MPDRWVYFQVRSSYYHYSEGCAGDNPHKCTLEEAEGVKEPCPNCVVKSDA